MKQPSKNIVGDKKIIKEIIYTLNCKKNGCLKLQIHRFIKENSKLKKAEVKHLNSTVALNFLKSTTNERIKLPQICPIKNVPNAKSIPWVYGKAIDGYTQVVRYIDESGNRKIIKNNKLHSEIIKTNIKIIKPLHSTL